jgi:hypothetical protein
MEITPTVRFRRMRGTDALEADILERLERLETFCPSLVGARVLVELADRHHRDGNRCRVRIELSVPGEDVVVRHEPSLRPELRARGAQTARKQDEADAGHRYAKVAIREAFEVARRQLQDHVRRQRGLVKTHGPTRRKPVLQPRAIR